MDFLNMFTIELILDLYETVNARFEINDGKVIDAY